MYLIDIQIEFPEFVEAKDGETILFDLPRVHPLFGQSTPVRLDMEVPRKFKTDCEFKHWKRLMWFLDNRLSKAERIDLKQCKRDHRKFRLVCQIEYDGKPLGEELANKGVAFEAGTKVDWCNLPWRY